MMLNQSFLVFIVLWLLLFVVLGVVSWYILRASKKPPKPDVGLRGLPSKRSVYFALLDNYSLRQLEELCLQLELDFEELPGPGRELKARGLIDAMDERDKYPELVQAIQQDVPQAFRRRVRSEEG